MRRSRTRSRGPASDLLAAWRAVVAATLLCVPLGCVSETEYASVTQERDLLREERDRLAAGQANLEADRNKLLEQLENMRTERDALKKKVDQLTRKSSDLEARAEGLDQCSAENEKLKATYEGLVQDLEGQVAAQTIEIDRAREACKAVPKKKSPAKHSSTATPAK